MTNLESSEPARLSRQLYRNLVFVVGIIATFAYRIIVVLNYYSQLWVEISWYIGTLGFIWYFAHRYRVENKRDKLVEEKQLAEKIVAQGELSAADRESLAYILNGLKTSKAKWNYIFIFIFSVLALIYGIYNHLTLWLK